MPQHRHSYKYLNKCQCILYTVVYRMQHSQYSQHNNSLYKKHNIGQHNILHIQTYRIVGFQPSKSQGYLTELLHSKLATHL